LQCRSNGVDGVAEGDANAHGHDDPNYQETIQEREAFERRKLIRCIALYCTRVQFPDVEGYAVVSELRTWCCELAVLFLSGFDIVICSVHVLIVCNCTAFDGVHGQVTASQCLDVVL
jgi:hypothetical protein